MSHPRRDGTVIAVYTAPREGGGDELVIDVAWDPPAPGERGPWEGTSRGLPASRLYRPG